MEGTLNKGRRKKEKMSKTKSEIRREQSRYIESDERRREEGGRGKRER